VKTLKLSLITVFLSFIFLLINGAKGLYAYHDQGPSHPDANLVACYQANHHKSKVISFNHFHKKGESMEDV
jgi:hypothetical protein